MELIKICFKLRPISLHFFRFFLKFFPSWIRIQEGKGMQIRIHSPASKNNVAYVFQFMFDIKTPKRVYYLAADSEQVTVENSCDPVLAKWYGSSGSATLVTITTQDPFVTYSKLCLSGSCYKRHLKLVITAKNIKKKFFYCCLTCVGRYLLVTRLSWFLYFYYPYRMPYEN